MKRSQINQILQSAQAFFTQHQFHLPPWASWTEADWQGQGEACREVIDCQLGWDITDFGSGDFAKRGLTLFTVRNGKAGSSFGKTYAEKIMVVDDGQETPLHFHFQKAEDIINRGGGNLIIELWNAGAHEETENTDVTVTVDGCRQTHAPGSQLRLTPGESICLTPTLYHSFWGERGFGDVLVGEVSSVNDDEHDNHFLQPIARYNNIEEDEPALLVLCNEYNLFRI